MGSQTLVVSDPPHRAVDHDAVAGLLGLSIEDTRAKLAFWAPEVMSAADPDRDAEMAESLRRIGLNVALVDAADLAVIPWPLLASSVMLESDHLVARFDGADSGAEATELEIPYDRPTFAVHCKPPDGFVPPPPDDPDETTPDGSAERAAAGNAEAERGAAIAEAIQWSSCLDLYFDHGDGLRRLTVAEGRTRIGDSARASDAVDVAEFLGACQRRFLQTTLDARLRDVWPRQRFQIGASGFDLDLRKLFSYGTLLLRQALQSASPELGDLPQYELGSRMARVLRSGRTRR